MLWIISGRGRRVFLGENEIEIKVGVMRVVGVINI